MFVTKTAEIIANEVRWSADVIRSIFAGAFGKAIVNENLEVLFFRKLLREVEDGLNGISPPGLNITCRTKEIHQKPRVKVQQPHPFECELADLLVVVKYAIDASNIERKSLFYQVKLCNSGTRECDIDFNQLELLCDWPGFEFGLKSTGGPRYYSIQPHTLEFGSYMLMLRGPAPEDFVLCQSHFCHAGSYGISPHALAVRKTGSRVVDVSDIPYAGNAAEVFFSHLAFEIGEHHDFNPAVNDLVQALYRHLGVDPDPPGEFDGYFRDCNEEEPGFYLIEITVRPGKEFGYVSSSRPIGPKNEKKKQ